MIRIVDYLVQSRDTLQVAIDDLGSCGLIRGMAEFTANALRQGESSFCAVMVAARVARPADCRGDAAAAQYDRVPATTIALTTDSSVFTAIGNDYGYDRVFERQILGLGLGQPGDVLIAMSTSGRSPNILAAISAGRQKHLNTVEFF